jgi:hypothetical protein
MNSVEFLGSWDWRLMVLTAIIGGFITQLITLFVWWITKPRLCFRTGRNVPLVIHARNATWIRVRVRNWGWRNAESCRVYLTDIFREGATDPILMKDAMILQASSGGDSGAFKPLSISRKFGRFFDIAFIADHERLLTVTSDEFKERTNNNPKLPPGTYEFRIVAAGTNFNPVRRGIKVQFDGASAPIVSSFRLGGVFSIYRAIRSAIRKLGEHWKVGQ